MMRHSESLAKLAPALVKAQAEVENATKNANNPFYGSKYADLAEVLRVTKPVLAAHGLAVVQLPGMQEGHAMLETIILHESGEWIAETAGAPLPPKKTKKGEEPPDAQSVGSAVTYLRRYSLAAAVGIAQEDDDGNAARGSRNGNGHTASEPISDSQLADLRALMQEVEADESKFLVYLKVSELDKLPKDRYGQAVKALERKRKQVAS